MAGGPELILPTVPYGHPLAMTLDLSVRLRLFEWQARGGPQQEDFDRVAGYSQLIAEKGDLILFKSGKPGETADLFNKLAEAVSVLAFCPGGVKVFGVRYEGKPASGIQRRPAKVVSK